MNSMAFILFLVLNNPLESCAQDYCDNYDIAGVYDIPPSPQTPGGNYFLLLLSLTEDAPGLIDNYANIYFIDESGDTISIPTGPSSILPLYASDTIPYILELNSTLSNQDFPTDFRGYLNIIHSSLPPCKIAYGSLSTGLTENAYPKLVAYPNPFENTCTIESNSNLKRIAITGMDGKTYRDLNVANKSHIIDLSELENGIYFIIARSITNKLLKYRIIKK